MNNVEKTKSILTLKRLNFLLMSFVLVNPIIIYLLSGSIIISFMLPFLFIGTFFFLRENRRTKGLSIIFFNFLFVISFLIHAETIFTYRFSDYIIDDLYVVKHKFYFNRPYLNQTFQDKEFSVQYKTNKQGFRIGSEDEAEVIVNEADWLFIGDSYTQGAQVQYEELYTTKLFNFFSDKIIVNAGISGMSIADEYNYYISEGKKLKAKKVFLQICNFNDFMNVEEKEAGFSDYLMHYSNFSRYLLYGFKFANPAELPLGRWTEPFYPDKESNENYNIFYKQHSPKKKRDLKNFELFLLKFNKAVKENGAELILLQIPTKEQIYYKNFEEVVSSFKIDVKNLDMNYPNKFLDSLSRKNKIRHLDLLSDFQSAENLFFQYDEHLNVTGHYQITKSIYNFLIKNEKSLNNQTLLSSLNLGDRYPNFSQKNQEMMIFQSFRDGNMEIFIGDSLLKKTKRITWNNVDEIHPWISPNGKQIVFSEGNQNNNKTKIVIMNIDGSERRYITFEDNIYGSIPSFNSDGLKITYSEWHKDFKTGLLSNPYIVIYDLLSGKKIYVTDDSYESWRPIFSPDGHRLFYISKEKNNQFDIFEYSFLTKQKNNISNTQFEEWDIAISNDGKKMVYAGNKKGNWDLFLMELKTKKSKQLTNTKGNEWDATFSPSNQYLYFSGTFGLQNGIFRLKF